VTNTDETSWQSGDWGPPVETVDQPLPPAPPGPPLLDDGPRPWDGPTSVIPPYSVWADAPARSLPDPAAGVAPERRSRRAWILVAGVAALAGSLIGGAVVAGVVEPAARVASSSTVRPGIGPGATRPPGASQFGGNPVPVKDVLGQVEPAVVSIRQRTGGGEGNGTGVIISADGEVVTNAHVVSGTGAITVTLFNETKPRAATVVGSDPASDVALLRITGASGLPTATFGDSDAVEVGDQVIAIGNALALPGGPSVTRGIISAKDRTLDNLDGLLQTDAAINPGNSGGPLVSSQAQVIGINTAVIRSAGTSDTAAQGIGFAIATNTITPLLDDLRKAGGGVIGTSGAVLGVRSVTVSPDIAGRLNLGVDRGAILVEAPDFGSAAQKGGLEQGDVIVGLGGTTVTSAATLRKAIRDHKPGDKVRVDYVRDTKPASVEVTLGAR
jgi:S1-C subfamily serine protease